MSGAKPLALVTGAFQRNRFRTGQAAGRAGYDLVINAEDGARLEHAAERIRAAGAAVGAVTADLRDHDQTEALFGLDALFMGRHKLVTGP
jgi:NAD(P)-dependent dehydrogenase (short-subunit alcohol dehydrogenase family)